MHHRTPITLASLALLAPLSAQAQQQGGTMREVQIRATAESNEFGANESVSTRTASELRDIPQSVTVINKSLMQSQGATSLASALRNVPGLTLGAAEGSSIGNNINLNGFSARTDVFLDGVRDRGQYFRDTFALDSIEVLMGPSSMLFGRGSTGGVLNQVSKKPRLNALTEASVGISSTGLLRSTVDVNRKLSDTSAMRVAAMAQKGAASTREQTDVRDYGIAPSLKLGIGTPTQITLSALLQHNRDMADYGIPPLNGAPAPVDRRRSYGYTDDRTVQDIASFGATVEHRLSPTSSLRNVLQYNQVTTDAIETAPQAIGTTGAAGFTALTPAATSALGLGLLSVRLQSHDRRIRDTSLFNQTEFSTRLRTGSLAHSLLAGLELGRDTYNNQNTARVGSCNGVALNAAVSTTGYVACVPLINPPPTVSPANAPTVNTNLALGSANTLGMYVNDTIQIEPRLKLVGGLRYDRYQAAISNSINAGNLPGNTTLARADQTVSFTSVRLGAIWQPDAAQSYYASTSTSFNPSLEQLVSTTGISQPLPPQQNRAYEVGGKWELDDGALAINAAVFRIDQTNSRSQNSDGSYSPTGTVRVTGGRLGATGRVSRQLQVFGGYTLLQARIVDAVAVGTQGRVPLNTPRDSLTVWAAYALTPQWELGLGVAALSARWANNTNTVQVPSYARWDASLTYRQPRYDVRLNLFNLSNATYYDALIQSDGGRAVPGSGRSALLSMNYRF